MKPSETEEIFDRCFAELSEQAQAEITTLVNAAMQGMRMRVAYQGKTASGFGIGSAKELVWKLVLKGYLAGGRNANRKY